MKSAAVVACLVSLAVHGPAVGLAQELAASLVRRADAIRPTPGEIRWKEIPWVRSVVDGQRMARAERRPIMYWHVDDDPLERC
jgi:hypothetical protein